MPGVRHQRAAGAVLCVLAGLLTAGLILGGLAGVGHAEQNQAVVFGDDDA